MRVLGGEQQQCPCYEEYQEFQKLLELKDPGLVIYCHRKCKENINNKRGGAVESAVNTTGDVFIVHNKNDVKITTSELASELGKISISCPRCRKIYEHAKELVQEVNSIERNDVMGICDHCRKKTQTIKNQICACDEIVKKFRSVKGEQKEDIKKYVKIWLSKIRHFLKDDKTLNKPKQIKSRAYSDLQINRDLNSFVSSHEPEIQQMFKSETHKSDINLNIQMRETDNLQGDYLKQGITFALPIEPVPTSFAHTSHEKLTTPRTSLPDSDTTFMETYEGIKELPKTSLKYRKQEETFEDLILHSRPSIEAKEELKRRHDFSLRQAIKFEKDSGLPFSVSKRPDVYETPKIAPRKQKESTPKYQVESEMDIKIKTKHDLGSRGLKIDSQRAKSKSWHMKAPEPKETGLKTPFSFLFPKVMKKEENHIQLDVSSSDLIKSTKEKLRLQTEKKREEKEHQLKEKKLEEEEKKKQAAEDQKKYKEEQERPLIDKEKIQDKALALLRDKSEDDFEKDASLKDKRDESKDDIFEKNGKLKGKRDKSREDIFEKDASLKGKRDESKDDSFEKDGKLKGKRDKSRQDIFEKDGTLKGKRAKSKEDIFEKDGKLKGKSDVFKGDIFDKDGKLKGERDKSKEDIFERDGKLKGKRAKSKEDIFERDGELKGKRDKSKDDIFEKNGKLKGKRDKSREDIFEKDASLKGKRDESKDDSFEKDGKLKGKRDKSKEDIFERDGNIKGKRDKTKEDIFKRIGKLKSKSNKSEEDIFERDGKIKGKRDKSKEDIFERDGNIKGKRDKTKEDIFKRIGKLKSKNNKSEEDIFERDGKIKGKRDKFKEDIFEKDGKLKVKRDKTKDDIFEKDGKLKGERDKSREDIFEKDGKLKGKRDKTKEDIFKRIGKLKSKSNKSEEDIFERDGKIKGKRDKSKDDILEKDGKLKGKRDKSKEDDFEKYGKLKGEREKFIEDIFEKDGKLKGERDKSKEDNFEKDGKLKGKISKEFGVSHKDTKSEPQHINKIDKDFAKALKDMKSKRDKEYLQKAKNILKSTSEQGDKTDELTQLGKKDLKSKPEVLDKTKKDVRKKSEHKEKGDEEVIESGKKDVKEKSKNDDLISKAMKYHKRKSETRDKEDDIKEIGKKGLAVKTQATKKSGQQSKEIDAPFKKGKSAKFKRGSTGDIEVSLSKIIIKKETKNDIATKVKISGNKQEDIKKTKETKEKNAKLAAEYKKLLAERLKEKEALMKKKQLQYEEKVKELAKEQAKHKTVPSIGIKNVKTKYSEDENDRILKLCFIKKAATMKCCDISPEILRKHYCHHGFDLGLFCPLCYNSELELDVISLENKKHAPKVLIEDIIKGEKICKIRRLLEKSKEPQVALNIYQKYFFAPPEEIISQGKPAREQSIILTKTDTEVEVDRKGILCYALSDRTFIEKGWTVLPTEKVVRKMNVYRMRPAHPEFDWFERNKNKRLMTYDTGEKLAEFEDNGRGRWYYRNGRLALDYYDAEETNAQQRFVIYSSGEPDERGRTHPITILATFDYLGNGIVFDNAGKIRLKYNQTEGVVLDRTIGPVSYWKWHSLNDPPVLQQVMIDTHMAHKDPNILKLGSKESGPVHPANEEMIAIEFENFIKEKSKKLTQKFKPFQIKMKALKINEHFSLRVLDQATVYLIFRDGSTNLKLNLGMILDHKEIVDTDTSDVGEVSNNLERLPARTDSLAGLQRSVAYAQRYERQYVERQRWLRPPEPCASADQLTAATSPPMRLPLRTLPTGSTCTGYCSRKPPKNLYYNTRL